MANKVNAESISHDKRIIARKLEKGELSEKDLQNMLKKLPDVSDDGEEVTLDGNEK
ncbi:MAG: hypothetical protein ABSD50_04180 [Smithella sp.]|jgi:hypothetical protein